MVQGSVSQTAMAASSAGVKVSASLIQNACGDGDEPKRAIGEIDHEQRQIAEPHGADRGENRGAQLVADVAPSEFPRRIEGLRLPSCLLTVWPIFTLISVKA